MSQRALVERTHVTIAQLGIVRGKLSDCILEDTYSYSIVNQISQFLIQSCTYEILRYVIY
jgi:hypothetical protein